ncbi:MAG TPA: HIT domain-containing protein [Acidimicrobiales bacterium]|nr:HIT domain-containing protein [Acidimicrobiales bacterium]
MTLDHLWAGWRAAYVASVADPATGPFTGPGAAGLGDGTRGEAGDPTSVRADAPDGAAAGAVNGGACEPACVFCELFASRAPDADRFVVWEDELVVVVLNAFPYASGHVLVMPRRHVGDLGELDAAESAGIWETARRAVAALGEAYSPDGVNLGANLGRAAGAGIPRHVHLHVVPRWTGDTNFMTTVAATRVLPEALPDSWAKLRAVWPS